MKCTDKGDTVVVTMRPRDLDRRERRWIDGPVSWIFRVREFAGERVVAELSLGPTLDGYPRVVLSEIAAGYAQGYLDGQARPDKHPWEFSSVFVTCGPYYDQGVNAGQLGAT